MANVILYFYLIILFLSVIIHEIAHGTVANYLGDPTAKYEGRLTLNPLKHIDPIGSIILPLLLLFTGSRFLFGWAKPVPINPYNFRDPKWGNLKVAIAGPGVNFLMALIFGLLVRFINLEPALFVLFSLIVIQNFLLGVFNLIPIPPLDGSWIVFSLLPDRFDRLKYFLSQYGLIILLVFIIFSSGLFLNFTVNNLYYFTTGHSIGYFMNVLDSL